MHLQEQIGYRFQTPALLQQALTHRSFSADHNERLEFLGDAVLNLSIAAMLYDRLKGHDEGDLSRVRASLVRQEPLFELATKLGLPTLLRLGEGESRSGGQKRPSILADALEALIGAVYLDAGYEAAEQMVKRLFADVKVDAQMQGFKKDPKTQLQEWLQGRKLRLPSYEVVATKGAAHRQTFEVACTVVELNRRETASGASRRMAEQAAAERMLQQLNRPA
jgi:ribonuclease-3